MQRLTAKKKMVGDFCGWRTIRRNEKIPVLQMLLGFPGCTFYWTSFRLNLLSFATKNCTTTSFRDSFKLGMEDTVSPWTQDGWCWWSDQVTFPQTKPDQISFPWTESDLFLTLMMLMAWPGKFSPNKVWSFYTSIFHRTLDMVNSSMGTLVQTGHTLEDNLYCAKVVIKRKQC